MQRDQDIWGNILNQLEDHINEHSFKTWFNDTTLVDIDGNDLHVQVPTKFYADYMNQNYTKLLAEISYALYKKKYSVRFSNVPLKRQRNNNGANYNGNNQSSKLNQKYTFDQFVVGKSNNFAHSASLAVAESPGTAYNPLFIYGESGMGKTHLMQAIAHFVTEVNDDLNIYYTTAEQFTNTMIEALKTKSMSSFRNKFRNIELLLVDDIHFLAGKESTQEEFFHTFNALYENRKQIVITSDRPLKEIHDLEKRLVTRFEWGLLADLKSPDFETRVAILRKKAENENIELQPDVIAFIAENIYSNVRALEGSLIRLLAFASYNNHDTIEIDTELARDILSDIVSEKVHEISLDLIMQKVCKLYGITPAQIFDKTRKKTIAFPRQVAMYLSNLLIPNIPLRQIAHYYKRKDHTTVLHAKKMIEIQFRTDNKLRIQIEMLIKEIKNQ
ncbi:MAG: chromosomal replication initiator protein DnaA [Candidatus Cloacimonetes bacterium]|nr:chromosomal replication initiator protein DnaA [Candidatus Cloacimonadota bacterium]